MLTDNPASTECSELIYLDYRKNEHKIPIDKNLKLLEITENGHHGILDLDEIKEITKIPDSITEIKFRGTNRPPKIDFSRSPQITKISLINGVFEFDSLPRDLNSLEVSHVADLVFKEPFPQNLRSLKFHNVNVLREANKSLGIKAFNQGLETIIINDSPLIKKLPKIPDSLKSLVISRAPVFEAFEDTEKFPEKLEKLNLLMFNKIKKIPDLPQGLIELRLESSSSIVEIPKLPPRLEIFSLQECKEVAEIPALPDSIRCLNLGLCPKLHLGLSSDLQEKPQILSRIEELKSLHEDFVIKWPQSFVNDYIEFSYKAYYEDRDAKPANFNNPSHEDEQHYPFYKLIHRYMSEDLNKRGSEYKIMDSAFIVSEFLAQNPDTYDYIDHYSSHYLKACINQPMRGFIQIGNMIEILKKDNLLEKIEGAKILRSFEVITSEIVKINNPPIPQGLEVEFENCMIKEINAKLLQDGIIKQSWFGAPDKVPFSDGLKSFLNPENIDKIYGAVRQCLASKSSKNILDSSLGNISTDFWPRAILGKEYKELVKPIAELKSKYRNEEISFDDFSAQEAHIKNEIFQKAREKAHEELESFDKKTDKKVADEKATDEKTEASASPSSDVKVLFARVVKDSPKKRKSCDSDNEPSGSGASR